MQPLASRHSNLTALLGKLYKSFRLFTNYASQCQGQGREKQGQAGTRQGQSGTRQGKTWTSRDKAETRQGQTGTSRDKQGQSLSVPACPCLSLSAPKTKCVKRIIKNPVKKFWPQDRHGKIQFFYTGKD